MSKQANRQELVAKGLKMTQGHWDMVWEFEKKIKKGTGRWLMDCVELMGKKMGVPLKSKDKE